MLAYLQTHWSLIAVPAFTIASLALSFAAQVFTALGETAPTWLGTASTWIGKALHLINGNVPAAILPPAPKA